MRKKFNLPPKGSQIIYIISIKTASSQDDFTQFLETLNHIKKVDHEGCSHITTSKSEGIDHFPVCSSNAVVYVGTSQSLASRLQQHVGHGSKGTATIMLRKWYGVEEKKLKIRHGYYDFGPNMNADLLKRLEYQISNQLKPLIGHNRRA